MTGFDRPPGSRLTRRETLGLPGTGALALALPGCATSPPLKSSRTAAVMDAEAWGGLATSLLEEKVYAPRVEGALPKGLRGTLYRNGPGLFDRGGQRRRALLDAARIEDVPVARILLEHHVPISFHKYWKPGEAASL